MQELTTIQNASALSCDYQKTLALLRALKAGTVSLDDVTLTENGWTVADVEPPKEDAIEPPDEDG
jgi:hypothetical protein